MPPADPLRVNAPSICIVGVGPRGTSVIERLAAIATDAGLDRPWTLHLVDDAPFGAGRTWRIDQVQELCMNTYAGALTLFTDEASTIMGPIRVGPTLYEWCVLAHDEIRGTDVAAAVPAAHREAFERTALPGVFLERPHLIAEAGLVRPESHPSRALYGAYLAWCFDDAVHSLPPQVTVVSHATRAVRVVPTTSGSRVHLADGDVVDADEVILALGWLENEPTAEAREFASAVGSRRELVWIRPGSPIEQELDLIPPGADTLTRGLGMGFFDAMAMLTIGRGGRFADAGRGMLRYAAAGDEPVLHVTSRRGVPFRAKPLWGGLPPRAEQTYFSRFDPAGLGRPVDFDEDLWPLIVQDAHAGWYRALAETHPTAFADGGLSDVLALVADRGLILDATAFDAAVAAIVPEPSDRFDLSAVMDPAPVHADSPAEFTESIARYLRDDLAQAQLGIGSPLKRALWEVNSARVPSSKAMSFDRSTADSHDGSYARFAAFGAMIGSGPPAFRTAQLLALVEAGLVRFVGPDARVRVDAEGFVAESVAVSGSEQRARVLLDAFMTLHDSRRSADPVVGGLVRNGHLRPYRRPTAAGGSASGPGVDVQPGTSTVVGASGDLVDSIHLIGIPLEDTRGDTAISPIPGTDATFLREADGAAYAALRRLFADTLAAKPILFV